MNLDPLGLIVTFIFILLVLSAIIIPQIQQRREDEEA